MAAIQKDSENDDGKVFTVDLEMVDRHPKLKEKIPRSMRFDLRETSEGEVQMSRDVAQALEVPAHGRLRASGDGYRKRPDGTRGIVARREILVVAKEKRRPMADGESWRLGDGHGAATGREQIHENRRIGVGEHRKHRIATKRRLDGLGIRQRVWQGLDNTQQKTDMFGADEGLCLKQAPGAFLVVGDELVVERVPRGVHGPDGEAERLPEAEAQGAVFDLLQFKFHGAT